MSPSCRNQAGKLRLTRGIGWGLLLIEMAAVDRMTETKVWDSEQNLTKASDPETLDWVVSRALVGNDRILHQVLGDTSDNPEVVEEG